MTIPQAMDVALQHHQAGRLAEAETIYRQILALDPDHADALQFLGAIASQTGHHDLAVPLFHRAHALAPNAPAILFNLGVALRRLGRIEEAIAAYRQALELKADSPEVHNNLGNALREQSRLDEAAAAFRQAIQLKPNYAEAHNNLGNTLREMGRVEESILEFRRAIHLKPDYAEAHGNLGIALRDAGRPEEAIAAYRRALGLKPDCAAVASHLGGVLSEQDQLDEAAALCRRAVELDPGCAEFHNNLGAVLTLRGELSEALAALRRALLLRADDLIARNNLGNALVDGGQIAEALAEFRHVLDRDPSRAETHSNLLLSTHYLPEIDAGAIFQEHRRWNALHARLPAADSVCANHPDPHRRLRIGYVSPDFYGHSVARFLDALLAGHDRSQVEIFCYSNGRFTDGITTRFRSLAAHWRDIVGLPDEHVADLIRQDGIDILMDLAGHTAQNRLLTFARKPAPVQVTYLGYCDTTGMSAMDWRLTDTHADPPGTTEHLHTEGLMRLPDSAWCFRAPDTAPAVAPVPASQCGHITFGSFNAMPKMNGAMLDLWARVLLAVPGSRLLLKNLGFQDPAVRQRTLARLEKAGLHAERTELAGRIPTSGGHLAAYGRMDIALDTIPYHGTTTTCEALWMGVPVVTLAGRTHVSRVGVSLLKNAGLPELISTSEDEYVRLAADLATDLPRLAQLRSMLRERMASSPVMDAPGFVRHVEQAYRKMWEAWCARPR